MNMNSKSAGMEKETAMIDGNVIMQHSCQIVKEKLCNMNLEQSVPGLNLKPSEC